MWRLCLRKSISHSTIVYCALISSCLTSYLGLELTVPPTHVVFVRALQKNSETRTAPLRTFARIRELESECSAAERGGTGPSDPRFFKCVPWRHNCLGKVPPPDLHLLMGVINHIYTDKCNPLGLLNTSVQTEFECIFSNSIFSGTTSQHPAPQLLIITEN